MARAYGARAQLLGAFEATYGTPPASGYFRLPFASADFGDSQPLLASELLGYGRDPLPPSPDVITTDGDAVVPIDLRAWGVWLKGAFGDPTTSGSDPYTHVFNSGSWDLPSLSLEKGFPEIPNFEMVSGLRVGSLNWRAQRGGLLTARVGLIGQGSTDATTSQAGTPTDFAITRFGQFNGLIERNGSALGNVVGATVTYDNGLDPVPTIRNDGNIDAVDPTVAALSGELEVRLADTVLIDQAVANGSCTLKLGFVRDAGTAEFTLDVHEAYLSKPRRSVTGPGGVQVTFQWQASQASSGANLGTMCTATLINDIASY